MIGKQVKGKGFFGCLSYVLGKKGATVVDGNVWGENIKDLARQFRFCCRGNPNVQRVVYHATLSVLSEEVLSDRLWSDIAQDYLTEMGFRDTPYIVVRHDDTEHNHIHIVAGRVRADGSCVSDSWDYPRSERVIRQLEQKYRLSSPQQQNQERRSPTTGEIRLLKRTGEPSIRQQLQEVIDSVCNQVQTIPDLVQTLYSQGVTTQVKVTRSHCIQGITFTMKDVTFSGTQLGSAYTFPGLQKKRGLAFDGVGDLLRIQQLMREIMEEKQSRQEEKNQLNSSQVEINQAQGSSKVEMREVQPISCQKRKSRRR